MADNTSPSRPAASQYQPAPPSALHLNSEAEYLQHQADQAMRAMKKAMREMRGNLTQGLSLHAVAKDHPWMTIAAGAVAGFATGAVITPNKRDAALKRLAEIERALHPAPPGGAATAGGADGHPPKKSSSLVNTLLHEVFALAKPVLVNGVTAMMAAHTAANEAGEQATERNAPESETV